MKKAIGLSLAAVMAMSLTACGGGKSDAPAAGTQAAGSEAAGSEAAGAEGDTIKLGVIGPLTGPAATYGIAVQNGADLAVKEINAAGGVDGMEIEELAGYIRKNCDSIREQIRKELYHPQQKKASKV